MDYDGEPNSNGTLSNETASTEIFNVLLSRTWPLEDRQIGNETSQNSTLWNAAMLFAKESLILRDDLEKNVPSLPIDSPSYRHQTVTSTSKRAIELSRIGYIQECGTKFIHRWEILFKFLAYIWFLLLIEMRRQNNSKKFVQMELIPCLSNFAILTRFFVTSTKNIEVSMAPATIWITQLHLELHSDHFVEWFHQVIKMVSIFLYVENSYNSQQKNNKIDWIFYWTDLSKVRRCHVYWVI